MSVKLEDLVLEFAANTASLDAAMTRAVAKARSAANQIDSLLCRNYGKNAQLNLTPKVDHRHLEALNKHIELKRSHVKDVQRYFNANPLTVRTNTVSSGQEPSVRHHSTTQRSVASSHVTNVDNNKLEEAVSKGTTKGIKASRGGLLGAAGRLVSAPARGIVSGFQEGIGLTIAQSYLKGIEKSLTVSIDNLAAQVGSATANTVSQVTTGTLSDILGIDLGKVFGSLGELEKKVRPDSKATEDEKLAAANEALFSFGQAVFTLTKNLGLVSGKVNTQAQWLQKIGANLETKIKTAAPEVAEAAQNIQAQKINQSQAVFTVGGFARASGKSGLGIAKSLREVVDPNSVYVQGIENTATDIAPGTTDQVAIRSLGKVKKLLTQVNEDAKNLAAQVIAFKRANPQTEVTLLGHSAGGAVVEQTMKLLSELGETSNVKGVGLGTPALGLGKGWAENYSRITGEGDVMNYLDLLLKGNTGDVRSNVVQGGAGHTAAAYLTSPDIQAALQKITGLNLKSNAKQADLQIKATLAVLNEIGHSLTQLGQLEPQFIEQEANSLQQQLETVGSIFTRNQPQVSDSLSIELEEGQLLVKQYIKDLQKQIEKANQTLATRRTTNQLERVGQRVTDATKTTIGNSVLGTVANIPLQAALARREAILKQHAAEIDKVFKAQATEQTSGKETGLFVIGGYAGAQGKSGHKVADLVSKTVDTDKIGVYGLENPYTDTSVSIQEDNAKWVTEAVQKIVDVRLVKGANPDAVAAAKQIAAFLRDNPQSDVAVAGYSSGGIVTKEILKLLEMAGLGKRVRGGVALGSPDIPFDFDNPENMRMFLGDMDGVKELMRVVEKYHLVGENKTKDQNLNRLYGHTVPTYLTRPEVVGHLQHVLGSDRVKPIKYGDFAIEDMRQQFQGVGESVQVLLSGQVNPFKHAPMYTATLKQISKLKSDLHDNLRDASVEIEKELLVLVEELDQAESVIASLFGLGNVTSVNQQLEKVAGAVAKLSGVSMGEIPAATVDAELDPNAKAMMHRPTNKVKMHSVDYQRLASGEMTDDMLSTLVHEMRHKMQPRLKNLITVDQASQVLPPNVVQMLKMKAINNVKDSGATGRQARQVFNEEFDAYAFEHLYKGKVKEIIKRNSQLLTEIVQTLTDATTQIAAEDITASDVIKQQTNGKVQDELTTLQAEVEGWVHNVKIAMEQTLNAPVNLREFKVATDLGGASGAIFNNKDLHLVQAEAQRLLKQNALEPFKSLLHELRHLQQPNLQRLINIKDLSAIDKHAADRIRIAAERSVEWTKQQGVSDPKVLEQVFAQEVDAYAFEELYAYSILGQLKGLSTKVRNQIQNSSHTRAGDRRLQKLLAYYQKIQNEEQPKIVNTDTGNKVTVAAQKATEATQELIEQVESYSIEAIEQLTQALGVQIDEVEPRRTLDFSDLTPTEFFAAYQQSIKQNLDELSKHLVGQVHGYVPRLDQGRNFTSDLRHVFDSLTSKGYENSLKSRLQQFRQAVASGQKKLAVDLGESLMEDLRVYKEVLRQLGEQVKADPRGQWMTAYKQMSAYVGEMTKAENEIMQGSKAKGRSSVGIQQLAEDPEIRNYLGSKERGQGHLTNDLARRQAEADAIARANATQPQTNVPLARIQAPKSWDNFLSNLTQNIPIVGRFTQELKSLGIIAASGLGLAAATSFLVKFGKESITTANQVKLLASVLGNGYLTKGLAEFRKIQETANSQGLPLLSTAKTAASLKASTVGTALESQATDIALSVGQLAVARGLDTQAIDRVNMAVKQISAKSRVSLEELNQQMGEALSGSLQMAAKAMGVTTAELIKMVENGDVLASELLPKLAAEFKRTAEATALDPSQNLMANLNRMENAVTGLKIAFGSALLPIVSPVIKTLADGLTAIGDNANLVTLGIEIMGGALVTLLLYGLKTSGLVNAAFNLLTTGGIKGAIQGLLAMRGALVSIGSALLVTAALTATFEFVRWYTSKGTAELVEANDKVKRSVDAIALAYERVRQSKLPRPEVEPPQRPQASGFGGFIDRADDWVQQHLLLDPEARAKAKKWEQDARSRGELPTYGDVEQEKNLKDTQETIAKVKATLKDPQAQNIFDVAAVENYVREISGLDQRIKLLNADLSLLQTLSDKPDAKKIKAIQDEIQRLSLQSADVTNKFMPGGIASLEAMRDSLVQQKATLQDLISKGYSKLKPELDSVDAQIVQVNGRIEQMEAIAKRVGNVFSSIRLPLLENKASKRNADDLLTTQENAARAELAKAKAGYANPAEAGLKQATIEKISYQERLNNLEEFIDKQQKILSKVAPDIKYRVENLLGKSIESAGLGDIEKAKSLMQGIKDAPAELERTIDALTDLKQAQLDASKGGLDLAEATYGAIAANREYMKNLMQVRDALDKVSAKQQGAAKGIEFGSLLKQANLASDILSGNLTIREYDRAGIKLHAEELQTKISQLKDYSSQRLQIIRQLNTQERQLLERMLGGKAESATLSQILTAKKNLEIYGRNNAVSGNVTAALDVLEANSNDRLEAARLTQQMLSEQVERIKSFRDSMKGLMESYTDYLMSLTEQINSTRIEVERLIKQVDVLDIKNSLKQALEAGTEGLVGAFVNMITSALEQVASIGDNLKQSQLEVEKVKRESGKRLWEFNKQSIEAYSRTTDEDREVSDNSTVEIYDPVQNKPVQFTLPVSSLRQPNNAPRASEGKLEKLAAPSSSVLPAFNQGSLKQGAANFFAPDSKTPVEASHANTVSPTDYIQPNNNPTSAKSDADYQYLKQFRESILALDATIAANQKAHVSAYERLNANPGRSMKDYNQYMSDRDSLAQTHLQRQQMYDRYISEIQKRTDYQTLNKSNTNNNQTQTAINNDNSFTRTASNTTINVPVFDISAASPRIEELIKLTQQKADTEKALANKQLEGVGIDLDNQIAAKLKETTRDVLSRQRRLVELQDQLEGLVDQYAFETPESELRKIDREVSGQFRGFSDSIKDAQRELSDLMQNSNLSMDTIAEKIRTSNLADSAKSLLLQRVDNMRDALKTPLATYQEINRVLGELKQQADSQKAAAISFTSDKYDRQLNIQRFKFTGETETNLLEAQASFGDANYMNESQVAKLKAHAATIQEAMRFQVELDGFDEMVARLGLTSVEAEIAKQQLYEINSIKLSEIAASMDTLKNQIKSGLQPVFESFFTDIIAGGKSIGEIFTDLIGSVAKLLAQLAAQVLVRAMFGGIFGNGGTVPNRAFGGSVPNYAEGGDVVGLGMAVAAAMKREGAGAVPIVAHVGEEVLTTRNGDAQFYRALRERGIWNEMKGVNNYELGGSVGGSSPMTTVRAGGSRSGDINVPVTVQYQAAAGEDERTSRAKAEQLAKSVRAVVTDELVRQSRSGGLLGNR